MTAILAAVAGLACLISTILLYRAGRTIRDQRKVMWAQACHVAALRCALDNQHQRIRDLEAVNTVITDADVL